MLPDQEFERGKKSYHEYIRDTQSFQKFLNYTEKLTYDKDFMDELRWFRKHIAHVETDEPLPLEGLPLAGTTEEHLKVVQNYDQILNDNGDDYLDAEEYIEREFAFKDKYGIGIFGDAFEFLLFYGSVEPMKDFGYCTFFDVLDLPLIVNPEETDFGNGVKRKLDPMMLFDTYAKTTPIALFIHPYMSERDIVDAVRKTYKGVIQPIQEKYKNKSVSLGAVRKRSDKIKERNDFIYENKEMAIKDLTSQVSKLFGNGKIYDYTYIQSILKKETDKRI